MADVDFMLAELVCLQIDMEDAEETIIKHDERLDGLNNFTNRLQAPATEALTSVAELANLVVQLNTASNTGRNTMALVRKCKSMSVVANAKFEKMHKIAKGLLNEANSLATDLTYEVTTAQRRQNRVREMQVLSKDRRASDVDLLRLRQNEVSAAQSEIEIALETKRYAEQRKSDMEDARVLRFIFTLGWGEVFDWGDLNEEIDDAKRTISSSQSKLSTSRSKLSQAKENVEKVDDELRQLDTLDTHLDMSMSRLGDQARMAHKILKTTQELRDNTFEASHCLSSLCGKSSVLFAQQTARKLAESVLAIQAVMSNQRVKLIGPFFHDPNSLYGTLKTIANSPAVPLAVDDMM